MGAREKITLGWRGQGVGAVGGDDFVEIFPAIAPAQDRIATPFIAPNLWEKPGGFEICIECWKYFMLGDDRDLSASRMKLAGGVDDDEEMHSGYESDPNVEQRRSDLKIGEATNAMINSLKTHHLWAIHKHYGIAQVWNFPQLDYLVVVIDAMSELEKKLRKNIATSSKFE